MSIPGPFLRAGRGEPKSLFMRLWTLLVAATWLAGCASQGTIERDRLHELAVGSTTSTELTRAWGPPLTEATMTDGRHVLTYRYIDLQNGPTPYFAQGFGPIGGTANAVTGQVTLTFDPQGVLLSYDMSGRS